MKKINLKRGILTSTIICMTMGILSCNNKSKEQDINTADTNVIFPKGKKVTNDNFTGSVWLNSLVQADSINQNSVGIVTFEPGARTKWHMHPVGQIILVTEGIGYYQEKGSSKIIIKKGDVVKCSANIAHWHGASADSKFVQIAITGREKGETIWLEAVSDNEYNKF